jgi:hypothetical protein
MDTVRDDTVRRWIQSEMIQSKDTVRGGQSDGYSQKIQSEDQETVKRYSQRMEWTGVVCENSIKKAPIAN